ncbi:hypothetical protein H7U35_09280 [Mediterranea massiliensis]|uniref:Uncharacterized protein n=1 Tax=Mediterranea massiliensis TaxID=1841865 RepID=A0ABS2E168_9BACT|nr:hypothetical protein [Mediterranea massiliensis]MBM6735410.1 hypothetical protein [Mediterranea massiliensis]
MAGVHEKEKSVFGGLKMPLQQADNQRIYNIYGCASEKRPRKLGFSFVSPPIFPYFCTAKKENPYKQILTNKDNEKRKRQIGQR